MHRAFSGGKPIRQGDLGLAFGGGFSNLGAYEGYDTPAWGTASAVLAPDDYGCGRGVGVGAGSG
jgi:hypothetical protein